MIPYPAGQAPNQEGAWSAPAEINHDDSPYAQEEVDMLASIGYYYNLQLYLVRNKESAKQVVIPTNVKNRAQEGNLFGDINSEVVSALKK